MQILFYYPLTVDTSGIDGLRFCMKS